jgi:tRNA A37 methylthiotransferase MiaB
VEDFKRIVNSLRAIFPELTLATDVICGFPGESKEAFEKTLQLVKEVRPDIVNVSKFFARPRTAAAEMQEDFVPFQETKRRSSLTAKLAGEVAFERNQRWVGWTGEILVDEVGKISGSWVGRNFAYKPITIIDAADLLGKTLRVKVVRSFTTFLKGEVTE